MRLKEVICMELEFDCRNSNGKLKVFWEKWVGRVSWKIFHWILGFLLNFAPYINQVARSSKISRPFNWSRQGNFALGAYFQGPSRFLTKARLDLPSLRSSIYARPSGDSLSTEINKILRIWSGKNDFSPLIKKILWKN